jgi:hypothetical protein
MVTATKAWFIPRVAMRDFSSPQNDCELLNSDVIISPSTTLKGSHISIFLSSRFQFTRAAPVARVVTEINRSLSVYFDTIIMSSLPRPIADIPSSLRTSHERFVLFIPDPWLRKLCYDGILRIFPCALFLFVRVYPRNVGAEEE